MIHLLWCTIRPVAFKGMHKIWMQRAKNPSQVKTHVGITSTQDQFNDVRDYLKDSDRIINIKTTHPGVCYPSYQLSSSFDYSPDDIIVFASDDFMCPQDWDEYLIHQLKDKDGALFVRDGYQKPDSSNMLFPAITIPIMTGSCLTKLNKAIYHPAYSHMFSDCELYINLKDLDLLIDNRLMDTTTFEHCHYAAGKRNADQNDMNYNKNWNKDSDTWNKRKIMSIEERLKL